MSTRSIHAGYPGLIEAERAFGLPFQRDRYIAAARERQRHREALQRELVILSRQINEAEAKADRLRLIRAGIEAQLARASA
jgi:predicted  nucleic acid-binding Zn-ribbon protein